MAGIVPHLNVVSNSDMPLESTASTSNGRTNGPFPPAKVREASDQNELLKASELFFLGQTSDLVQIS